MKVSRLRSPRFAALAAFALLSLGLSGCYYGGTGYYGDSGYCPPPRSYGYGHGSGYGYGHGYGAPKYHYGGYGGGYGGGYRGGYGGGYGGGYCPSY